MPSFVTKLKRNKLIKELMTRSSAEQFKKVFVSGLLSAGFEYSLLVVFTEIVGFYYVISNTIAYLGGFWLSFILNRYWSFKSKDNLLRQLLLYCLLFVINLGLTSLVLYFLTSIIGISYLISKIFVMGMALTWNFVIYKKIIYKS